jgi:shikimate dehydrogenase
MTHSSVKLKIFAVIGHPLSHSLSPAMHAAALEHAKIPAVYLPFEIPPERFKKIMGDTRLLPFAGFNVTVPYKEKIIAFLDSVSEEARCIGAVNTVKCGKKLSGFNTDAYGFIESLKQDLRFQPRGKRVLLIGAGGAARACVYGLAKEKARAICIADQDARKARALKNHFTRFFKEIELSVCPADPAEYKVRLEESDLLINATPVGLKKSDSSPVPLESFPPKKIAVYDLIYNPHRTRLLEIAQAKKCSVSNGCGMLINQGARAFKIWTGQSASVAVMKKALLKNLGA